MSRHWRILFYCLKYYFSGLIHCHEKETYYILNGIKRVHVGWTTSALRVLWANRVRSIGLNPGSWLEYRLNYVPESCKEWLWGYLGRMQFEHEITQIFTSDLAQRNISFCIAQCLVCSFRTFVEVVDLSYGTLPFLCPILPPPLKALLKSSMQCSSWSTNAALFQKRCSELPHRDPNPLATWHWCPISMCFLSNAISD